MTPREKAIKLVNSFMPHSSGNSNNNEAKQCALIAVDEILEVVKFYEEKNGRVLIDNIRVMYWQELKEEIENL